MLLRPGKVQQLPINSPQTPSNYLPTPITRRHSVTAKTKSRIKTPFANKTISIRPEGHHSSAAANLNIQNSSELLPNSTFSFYNNQPALNQFDNLQLQDFLKYVIVGENKVPQDKSQQIIRSLNGTWFKNTQSSQLPSSKLYNNLGIRRNRMSNKSKESQSYMEEDQKNQHFMKQYTPPNIFPGKKIGSKKMYPSKSFMVSDFSQKIKINQDSPLKLSILKRMPKSQMKSNNINFKRSQSHIQKKKSAILPSKVNNPGDDDGLIRGTRMQLHKD